MCDENIEIGVTEITNNILVSATPTDQKIDINVTETTEDVELNITPSVVEVNIDVTQELITEIVTVDAETCVNIVDVSVTDATDNVTLNITPSIVEVNINRGGGGGGSATWGDIGGTLSDQTDLQSALDAKQNALGFTPVPTTRTITINGVTYDLSANRSWTVAGGLSGSGTTGYLTKWTGATALGNSIAYEDANNFLIGTTTSLYKLTVNTATNVNFGVGRTSLFGTNDAIFLNAVDDIYTPIPLTINGSHIGLYIGYSEKVRVNALGRVLIGTTTDNGADLLQVNGSLVASSIKKSGGTSSQFLKADGSIDTNTYLISYTETDPIYTASSWYTTTNNASNWNTAYGWGNHASAGYLTSITSSDVTIALGFTPVPTTRTLTINGTTYDLSADRSWTISGGGGITGSGTTNYIAKWTSSSAVGNSLIYDNGTNVGIGTSFPQAKFDVSGNDANRSGLVVYNANTADGDKQIHMFVGGTSAYGITAWQNSGVIESVAGLSSNFVLSNYQTGSIIFSNSGRIERMRILADGRVAIGSSTTIFSSAFQVYQNTSGNLIAHFYDSGANTGFYWYAYSTSMILECRNIAGSVYRNIVINPYGGNLTIGKVNAGNSKFGVYGLPTSSAGLTSGDFYQVSGVVMVVP